MTMMDERSPFEPKGSLSRRMLVLQGLRAMPPLEPRTRITFDMIAEWLGEEFPIQREGGRGYDPMGEVKAHLLRHQGVLLLNEENIGYRVATDAEMIIYADEHGYRKAERYVRFAGLCARSARPSMLSAEDKLRAEALKRDAASDARVLREHRRAREAGAKAWDE